MAKQSKSSGRRGAELRRTKAEIKRVLRERNRRTHLSEIGRLRTIAEAIGVIQGQNLDVLSQEEDIRDVAETLDVPYLFVVAVDSSRRVTLTDVDELTKNEAAMEVLAALEDEAADKTGEASQAESA